MTLLSPDESTHAVSLPRRLGQFTRTTRFADLAFIAVATATFLALLLLGRHLTFFNDEWYFIQDASNWSLSSFIAPHVEHLSAIPILVYKVLMVVFGLRTYTPYLAVLLTLHVATAAAIYWSARYKQVPVVGLTVSSAFLLFGSGFENLFWAFQIGFVGATAAGLWATVLLLFGSAARQRLAAVLLVVAVASATPGLFFVGTSAIGLVLARKTRALWTVIPALGLYVTWYLLAGSAGMADSHLTVDPETVTLFAWNGWQATFTALAGSNVTGVVAAIGCLAGFILWARRRFAPAAAPAVAAFCGVWLAFAIIGLGRADLGSGFADQPRYVYIAAGLVLIAVVGLMPRSAVLVRTAHVAVVLVAAWSIAINIPWLITGASYFSIHANRTRAAITLVTRYGGTPALPMSTPIASTASGYDIPPVGSPEALQSTLEKFGSPLIESIAGSPDVIAPANWDLVLYKLVRHSITVVRSSVSLVDPIAVDVRSTSEVTIGPIGDCLTLKRAGDKPSIHLALTSGLALALRPDSDGTARIYLGLTDSFPIQASETYELGAGSFVRVVPPTLWPSDVWLVRIDLNELSTATLCVGRPTSGAP